MPKPTLPWPRRYADARWYDRASLAMDAYFSAVGLFFLSALSSAVTVVLLYLGVLGSEALAILFVSQVFALLGVERARASNDLFTRALAAAVEQGREEDAAAADLRQQLPSALGDALDGAGADRGA